MIEQYAYDITALLIFVLWASVCTFITLALEWVNNRYMNKKIKFLLDN